MTKHIYIITALFISASPLCHAMEVEKQNIIPANILATITAIKKPESVVCLLDTIAILGQDGCSLCDFSGKEIIKLEKYEIGATTHRKMSAHPNKTIFVTRINEYLTVYDVTTKEEFIKKIQNDWCGKPIFSSIDDIIFIGDSYQNIRSLHYKNNSDNLHTPQTSIPYFGKMLAFHPTKQELLCTNCHTNEINVFHAGKDPRLKRTEKTSFIRSCQYSPDGKLIAISCAEPGCLIVNYKPNSETSLSANWLKGDKNNQLCAMQFHPTSSILAILPKTAKYICYWNATTQELITTTPLPTVNSMFYCDPNYSLDQRIDFSVDGTKVIVIRNIDCFILRVPFEVLSGELYQYGTKNKCAFAFWMLKNYLHEGDMLPQDITLLLTYNLFLAAPKFN